ncbi:hypothetical protein E4U56_007814 [Claviceps arundinis]|uniref:Uncharacterized protein n=1 Tax=Claviceps arundinis TaxID=1623583 RepID=A0A9P7MU39_9HYPO|nr:hypothetical protein E4U56_007814 [Claviceps arundinis]
MALPFDPDVIKRNLRAHGFTSHHAAMVTHLALDKLREIHGATNQPVPLQCIAEAIKQHAAEEVAREKALRPEIRDQGISMLEDMEEDLQRLRSLPPIETHIVKDPPRDGKQTKRFLFDDGGLEYFFGAEDPYRGPPSRRRDEAAAAAADGVPPKQHRRDIITALCSRVELAVELGKHLGPEDLISLYATSRTFHETINEHLLSSIRTWIEYRAPEAGRIFKYKLYRRHLIPDPAGRTWAAQYKGTSTEREQPHLMLRIRTVPGMRYLQLVLVRDRCCRQILAIMARNGFLMPKSMHHTLLQLWLLMDIPTTGQRQALLRNTDIWTDQQLYNAQLLFVKLSLMFNSSIYGPLSNELLHLALGEKGLYPLWQLLMRKRFTTLPEVLAWKVRYSGVTVPSDAAVYGVPAYEVGIGHMEGWGLGEMHLQRPDELIPTEAVARGLELDEHIMYMMLWGTIDFVTTENIVPTEEDIYISDEEDTLEHMDTSGHWKEKHALKKRFLELTASQQEQIVADDEDDRMRALAWTGDTGDDSDDEAAPYTLDDEIRRGYIVRQRSREEGQVVPPCSTTDAQGWCDFVEAALRSVPPECSVDQALRAQVFEDEEDEEIHGDWDWEAWLAEQGGSGHAAVGSSSTEQDVREGEGEGESEEEGEDNELETDDDDDSETIILGEQHLRHEESDGSEDYDMDAGIDKHGTGSEQDAEKRAKARHSLLFEASEYFRLDSTTCLSEQLRGLLQEHVPQLVIPEEAVRQRYASALRDRRYKG